jgi:hypothetical protein
LIWTEKAGPAVAAPTRRSFGTRDARTAVEWASSTGLPADRVRLCAGCAP